MTSKRSILLIFVISTGLLLMTGLTGCKRGIWGGTPSVISSPLPSLTPAQRRLQENLKILHEMFQVVWLREPYGQEEFNSYANGLSQGGSLEGIYNGFVNSTQYQKMEESGAPAEPVTVHVFSEQIALLQKELSLSSRVHPSDLGVVAPYAPARYEQIFNHASLYRLKRLLADEAMKVIEAKRGLGESREELAQWYAGWAFQLASLNVDFGLPLRNSGDRKFHRDWVQQLPTDLVSDRVFWEVVNRVHRLLGETEAAALKRK